MIGEIQISTLMSILSELQKDCSTVHVTAISLSAAGPHGTLETLQISGGGKRFQIWPDTNTSDSDLVQMTKKWRP